MANEPVYTFTFVVRGRTGEEDHETVRQVPFSKLLSSYDAAWAWRMVDPGKRSAFVFGPGMSTRYVHDGTREYILSWLPENMKHTRTLIGLSWVDITGTGQGHDYRLHKIFRSETLIADRPDNPDIVYEIAEVEQDDWGKAFEWARLHFRYEWGIWIHGRPGIVFTPDYDEVATAFLRMPETNKYLSTMKLMRAPVRYDWTAHDAPYPYIAPTRERRVIQALRGEFPNAHEDLLVAPKEALIVRYGYSRQTA